MRRLRPGAVFDSFLGLLDIKLGEYSEVLRNIKSNNERRRRDCTSLWREWDMDDGHVEAPRLMLTWIQLINKVAGVYGLITILVGGSFAQLSFYAYSVATLFAFLWALRIVKSVLFPLCSSDASY
jgi:hypothetical protein